LLETSCWVSIKGEETPRAEDEENSSKTQKTERDEQAKNRGVKDENREGQN
jgi:hypothetical protein